MRIFSSATPSALLLCLVLSLVQQILLVTAATYSVSDFVALRAKAEAPSAVNDVISLASGTYQCNAASTCFNDFNLLSLSSGKFITISCLADDLSCVLSGEGKRRHVNIYSTSGTYQDGWTFRALTFDAGTSPKNAGGSLYLALGSSRVTVNYCVFINNYAGSPNDWNGGGAIYVYSGLLYLNGVSFSSNSCASKGADVYLAGTTTATVTATASSSPACSNGNAMIFTAGASINYYIAAGAHMYGSSSFVGSCTSKTFTGPTSSLSTYISSSTAKDVIVLDPGTTFTGTCTGAKNFASACVSKALTIACSNRRTRCTLDGDAARNVLWFTTSSPSFVEGLIIQNGNYAMEPGGGGIYLYDSTLTVTNCFFLNNKHSSSGTTGGGGAIYVHQLSTLSLYGTSFSGNTALSASQGNDIFKYDTGSLYLYSSCGSGYSPPVAPSVAEQLSVKAVAGTGAYVGPETAFSYAGCVANAELCAPGTSVVGGVCAPW